VYTALSIFALMTDPITTLVMSLSAFAGSIGSFTRIQEFLEKDTLINKRLVSSPQTSSEELVKGSVVRNLSEKSSMVMSDSETLRNSATGTPPRSDTPPAGDMIIVHDAEFSWDPNGNPLLTSINMVIPESRISMVVGPVGCGKSTLLKAILGEVPSTRGSVYIATEQIAYCDQTAWHMNDTIKNSILASSALDEQWYDTVLQACALYEDLRQLPRGDQTMIGSKGVALSTGQAQRIVSKMRYHLSIY
jgi:ABC-type multidrug transport system fused ATPase/permease subunit